MTLRTAWSTKKVPGHPGLHKKTLSHNKINPKTEKPKLFIANKISGVPW